MKCPKSLFSPKRYLSTLSPSPNPPRLPLSLLADKCCSMTQLKQIHAQMIATSRISDDFAASRLLSFAALSDAGDINYAIKLFNNTRQPNMFMWNTLIRALAISSTTKNALFFYMEMRRAGVSPNGHTFSFLLKCCSIESCKQVHSHVSKLGFGLDLHVVNKLMRVYSLSNNLTDARLVFDEIPQRNLTIWTTMITGYAQSFCSNEALELFYEMIAEGFEPNGPTIASVLSACARSGCTDLGQKIHSFMVERGIEMGVIISTALVHMYAKNGEISKAKQVFDKMPERNTATWSAMICGLANHGHAQEAISLFRKLEKEQQLVPNDSTFVGVLSACCHAGLIDLGRRLFNSMEKVYKIKPKIEHYGCMVDLLGKGGKLEEAEELIKGMPLKPDVVILGALLSACMNHGSIEIAERVAKEIWAMEPDNHMAFVMLSNMYAEAGRWKDVSKLRKRMKAGKVEENAGLEPGW